MKRFQIFGLAAISWLPLFAMVNPVSAHNKTYNVSTDWLATYPSSTSILATHSATWGVGSAWTPAK